MSSGRIDWRLRQALHLSRILFLSGILVLLLFVGVLLGQGMGPSDPIYETETTEPELLYSETLDGNSVYRIEIEAADVDTGFAEVNGTVWIRVNGSVVFVEDLYCNFTADTNIYSNIWSEYSFTPSADVDVIISGNLTEGNLWKVKIYQDEGINEPLARLKFTGG